MTYKGGGVMSHDIQRRWSRVMTYKGGGAICLRIYSGHTRYKDHDTIGEWSREGLIPTITY